MTARDTEWRCIAVKVTPDETYHCEMNLGHGDQHNAVDHTWAYKVCETDLHEGLFPALTLVDERGRELVWCAVCAGQVILSTADLARRTAQSRDHNWEQLERLRDALLHIRSRLEYAGADRRGAYLHGLWRVADGALSHDVIPDMPVNSSKHDDEGGMSDV